MSSLRLPDELTDPNGTALPGGEPIRHGPLMRLGAVLCLLVTVAPGDLRLGAAEAERQLIAASSFKDVAVGLAATTPPEVHAYRALLAASDGVERFHHVLDHGTPAGQLYALCGLFFLDATAFDKEFARLEESRAKVDEQVGCTVMRRTVRELLAASSEAPRMSHSGSVQEWHRVGSRASVLDIPGGSTCYRLRFLRSAEDGSAPGKDLK